MVDSEKVLSARLPCADRATGVVAAVIRRASPGNICARKGIKYQRVRRANLTTKAVRDGDDYVLNGSKTFITGGMRSDYFVVAARTGGEGLKGVSLFLVESGFPGFAREPLKRNNAVLQ